MPLPKAKSAGAAKYTDVTCSVALKKKLFFQQFRVQKCYIANFPAFYSKRIEATGWNIGRVSKPLPFTVFSCMYSRVVIL